ncbi:MAG: SWIM zinc finger family protein, partial [Paenibacillus macerans]
MSFQLTQRVIKLLCGRISYERGEAYYRAGKVIFQQIDHASRVYAADVSGTGLYHVSVQIDQHGDVHAECNCPAFYTYTNYCKHIAAVLLGVHDLQQNGKPPVRSYPSLLHTGLEEDERYGERGADDALGAARNAASQARPVEISSRDIWIARDMMHLFEDNTKQPLRAGTRFDARTPLQAVFTL